jgi:probable rRNA maturation factor
MNISVDIRVDDDNWTESCEFIENRIYDIWKEISKKHKFDQDLEISVLLTSDEEVKSLNSQYRKKDKKTNILSFPQWDNEKAPYPLPLGDLALSFEYIKNEAILEKKELNDHLTHLLLHGILHLIGYDHIEEEDANKMEQFEIKVMKSFSISNPYKEVTN